MRAVDSYPTHAIALATAAELGIPARSAADADYEASRLAARRAIRALVGSDVSVVIRRRPGRAPTALVEKQRSVALSLAHRDGLAVAVAAPPGTRVGVDIERLDEVAPDHIRYFLTARERRMARPFPGALLWALKESAWKALALGEDVPLAALELDLDARGGLHGVWLRGDRLPATAAFAFPWSGYVVATVWIGRTR